MDPVEELLTTYNDLNSSTIEELSEAPSALEFMRYVARNRPFVIRGGCSDWKATQRWNASYLRKILQDEKTNVAVTPNGRADAPTVCGDELLFVKPLEEERLFGEFLDFVTAQDQKGAGEGEVWYAQTQNDNLRGEYASLFADVSKDIPWARLALQTSPEAINFWLGSSASVTALHKDNYENVYCQIIGEKHFVLLPPVYSGAVAEKPLKPATYVRGEKGLEVRKEQGQEVPFAVWDPDSKGENGTKYSEKAVPMRVTLGKGDMLYLPAMWYHKVSQSCSHEGFCVAVNYWYDMDFGGHFFPSASFVRTVSAVKKAY